MSNERQAYEDHDCGVIALQMTTGKTYDECHQALKGRGRRNRCGTHQNVLVGAAHDLGFAATRHYLKRTDGPKRYTMKTVADALHRDRSYIIYVSGHFAPFIDGEVRDDTANTNARVKWVYEIYPRRRIVPREERS